MSGEVVLDRLPRTRTLITGCGEVSKFCSECMMIDMFSSRFAVNRWLSARFNLLSSAVVGLTGFFAILTPGISASTAGFALAFASTVTNDVGLGFSAKRMC